ncbi:peptidase G1 [Boletus edulis]|nr:peptidase G1 [Boletus edulis]
MRLNCALVSSFLFIFVLAGDHQPPSLDRTEKSIITAELPITNWAGAVRLARSQGETISYAAATFTVPSARGATGSSFNILVGISGYPPCVQFVLNVVITVTVNRNGVSYQAWGQGYNGNVMVAPDWFLVSTGQEIRAIVRALTLTSGLFILINLNTGRVWAEYVSGGIMFCHQDAAWIITTPQSQVTILPNFHTVTFTAVLTKISGTRRVPDNLDTVNIRNQGRVMTDTQVNAPFVIIRYL